MVVAGGADRTASVQAGLNALSSKVKLAAIHDGARPLVSYDIIDRTVRAAHNYGAAAPAIPVKDTVKIVKGGVVTGTPDRATLRAVQTPQVFDFDLLRAALKKVTQEKIPVTDDCSAVEHMGMSVKIVEGEEKNIKITTPMDLRLAEMLMEESK
jgi:2-C-methyl-D-erythritol 4-phosphate cytidylyltransferase